MSQGLCPSCGAAVNLTAGQTNTKCHYCDSMVTLQQAEAQASEVKHSKFAGSLMIAETAQEGGSYAEAINYFNKVIEQEPTFADAWLNKGICLVRTSKIGDLKIPEAISSWKAAIKFAKNPEAMKKRVATEITDAVSGFYPVLDQHYIQFRNLDNALDEHGSRFLLLESALSLALELSPSVRIANYGISMCDHFAASVKAVAGTMFDAFDSEPDKGLVGVVSSVATARSKNRVADNLARALEATKSKYERVLEHHDPTLAAGFQAKQRKLRLETALKAGAPPETSGIVSGCGTLVVIISMLIGGMLLLETVESPSALSFGIAVGFLSPGLLVLQKRSARKNGRDTNWRKALPTCFGTADLVLAGHPEDEERLLALLETALRAGFSLAEIRSEIEKHLKGRGCPAAHIRKQLESYDSLTTGKYEASPNKHAQGLAPMEPASDSGGAPIQGETEQQAKENSAQGAGTRGIEQASKPAKGLVHTIKYFSLMLFLGVVALWGILTGVVAILPGKESFGRRVGLALFGLALAAGAIWGIRKLRSQNAASKG